MKFFSVILKNVTVFDDNFSENGDVFNSIKLFREELWESELSPEILKVDLNRGVTDLNRKIIFYELILLLFKTVFLRL